MLCDLGKYIITLEWEILHFLLFSINGERWKRGLSREGHLGEKVERKHDNNKCILYRQCVVIYSKFFDNFFQKKIIWAIQPARPGSSLPRRWRCRRLWHQINLFFVGEAEYFNVSSWHTSVSSFNFSIVALILSSTVPKLKSLCFWN